MDRCRGLRPALCLPASEEEPGFSAAAIATLTLGIGATTAIVSVVYAVLLKPLPYAEPERIYSAEIIVPERREQIPSIPAFSSSLPGVRDAQSDFSEKAALRPWECNLTGDAEPERVGGARVSANFFSFLGVSLANGRGFAVAEERAQDRIVMAASARPTTANTDYTDFTDLFGCSKRRDLCNPWDPCWPFLSAKSVKSVLTLVAG